MTAFCFGCGYLRDDMDFIFISIMFSLVVVANSCKKLFIKYPLVKDRTNINKVETYLALILGLSFVTCIILFIYFKSV